MILYCNSMLLTASFEFFETLLNEYDLQLLIELIGQLDMTATFYDIHVTISLNSST